MSAEATENVSNPEGASKALGSQHRDGTQAITVRVLGWLVLGMPLLWLWLVAAFVTIEYYDGYDAICNARFFAGDAPYFIPSRGPLLALILLPARLLTRTMALHPLEVRPYHLTMAAVHTVYLIGVFEFLRRRIGKTPAVLVAFVTSVLNVVFFSYAPFLSRDIAPGLVLVAMLILAEHFAERPRIGPWLGLVALGAAAALYKQTYGVFWLAILISRFLPWALPAGKLERTKPKAWLGLAGGAALSGTVYWLLMGAVLTLDYPGKSLLYLPYQQIMRVLGQTAIRSVNIPVWIYLRNLPFYGVLSLFALVPGIVLCLHKDRFRQSAALVWIAAFLLLHGTRAREVRYMAFLAPLSAFLVAHALQVVFSRKRRLLPPVFALLGLDVWAAGHEALRLREEFYLHSPEREFCNALVRPDGRLRKPVFWQGPLTFMPPMYTPFSGDRFHRLFHLDEHHLKFLYAYDRADFRKTSVPLRELRKSAPHYPGSVLFLAPRPLVNSLTLRPRPPIGLSQFSMASAVSERIAFPKLELETGPKGTASPAGFVLRAPGLRARLGSVLAPCLYNRTTRVAYPLEVTGESSATLRADGLTPEKGMAGVDWEVWGFSVRGLVVPARPGPGLRYVWNAAQSGKDNR